MLTEVRSKLSFANVVSVLALFLALTGGAVALQGKNSVDSGDIQKNAVKSPDIAANTVKGGDANEATFGQVPSAANADNATNAQNATHAQSADTAANAALLDDRDSTSFAAADRFRFGTADHTATSPQTLFAAGGITMTTDGDADIDATIRIVNASASQWTLSRADDTSVTILPTGSSPTVPYSPATGRVGTLVLRDFANPQRALLIHCGNAFNPNSVECWGFLSPTA